MNAQRCRAVITWLVLSVALPLAVAAHGDLHARIVDVTEQIAHDPTNAALYLKRGDLYRQHHAWESALRDLARAADLDPGLPTLDLLRGLTLLDAGQWEAARAALTTFLTRHPEHAEALVARARAAGRLGPTWTPRQILRAPSRSCRAPITTSSVPRS